MGILGDLLQKAGITNPDTGEALKELDKKREEEELAQWVRSQVEQERSSASRIAHEAIWMQNCAYTVGFNGLYFNTNTRSFAPINRAAVGLRRNRINVNKILPSLQNRLARLTKNPPKYDVRPNDQTQEAKDNAAFKLDILRAKFDDLKLLQKRLELLMWVQQTGHAYLGLYWDDTLGKYITDPETGEGMFEGDMRVDVISPLEMFPDPLAKSFETLRYITRATVRPLTYFRDQYGEKGELVKEEQTWLQSLQFETRINSMNTRGPSTGNQADSTKHTAVELTYYEKASKAYPRGRMIVVAGGVLLEAKELPCGKFPFAKFDDIPVAGKYYAECVVTHARPIQDQYNQIIRRRADWVNKMLAGKYISPRGNELIREAMTDENSEIVQYTPVPNAPNGGEPRALDIPTIPSYTYTEDEKLEEIFNEIFGISEISKGQLPAAGIPAIGMQLLVEQDDTRIGVMTEQHELSYADFGTLILDYVQDYYITPRKMKFAGKNSYIIKDVSGDQLQGENDVTVVRGSTVPGSKALRRQEIVNAWQQGLLGDPADPKVRQNVTGMLEYGDVSEIYLDYSIDQNRIKKEIEEIEQAIFPDIDEADNHVMAYQELNRYRKSDKFTALSPESQEIFFAVREEHMRYLGLITGAIKPELTPEEEMMAQDRAAQSSEAEMSQLDAEMSSGPEPMEPPSATDQLQGRLDAAGPATMPI